MKRLIFSMAVLFFGIVSPKQIKAQDPSCVGLRTQLEEAEKMLGQITGRKVATDDFINLVYEPSTDALIDEEIEFTNTAIARVNAKIIAGDKSPENNTELQLLRDRLEMLKLKKQGKLSLADPRLDEQTKAFKALLKSEEQQKNNVSAIQLELKKRNCPAAKSGGDDLVVSKEIDDGKAVATEGTWKYAGKDGNNIFLKLTGTGSSTSGKMSFAYGERSVPDYNISNCRENGENKLVCDFNNKAEDYEKMVETTGTVSLNISANSISTAWQEVGQPKVTWKPGYNRDVAIRAPKAFNIVFTK